MEIDGKVGIQSIPCRLLWAQLSITTQNSYVEVLLPGLQNVLGDSFERGSQGSASLSGWNLSHYDWCPYRKQLGHRHAQREGHVRTQGEGGQVQTEKKDLRKTSSAHTLIFTFQTLELGGDRFL